MPPICGFRKDIRDDAGQWVPMKTCIPRHSEERFSAGVYEKYGQKFLGPVYQRSRVTVRV